MQTPVSPTPRRKSFRGLSFVVGCCIALLVAACGGSSGSGSMSGGTAASSTGSGSGNTGTSGTGSPAAGTVMSCTGSCGSTMLTMTDAAGDFLSYIVTLTSLQLQTASGASVETLPASTQVDFTKLVDLTEVISAGQIPAAD